MSEPLAWGTPVRVRADMQTGYVALHTLGRYIVRLGILSGIYTLEELEVIA